MIGTFTRNSHCQLSELRMTPPMMGPRIGPIASGRLTVAMSFGLAFPPDARTARVCSSGKIRPAANPWSTRKAIRLVSFQASEHSTDPTTKSTSAVIHRRLPPMRFSAQPVIGMATAIARR